MSENEASRVESPKVKLQAEEQTRQAEITERAAKRLATGYWEKDTPDYNEKRHSAYWCAKVSFPSGPKPVYSWGESTGTWGRAGLLRVECKPGDIIAWGQKDLRRPEKSANNLLLMLENGRMQSLEPREAFRIYTETLKA